MPNVIENKYTYQENVWHFSTIECTERADGVSGGLYGGVHEGSGSKDFRDENK